MVWSLALAGLPALIWLGLLLGRDGFFRAQPRLDADGPALAMPPAVVAIVPARDEAATIAATVRSLLAQDYPGSLSILVVDDHSSDGTTAIVERLRPSTSPQRSLAVLANRPLPQGWSGKLWAIATGLGAAPATPYLLLTDADIAHDPGNLRRLVAKAEADRLDLVSLMVRLRCQSLWERFLVPPFVFFFQLLYPFAAVNDPARRSAAAAGGCVLLRRDMLAHAGGIEAIRGALIDDIALARRIKGQGGRIWLGLTARTTSLRAYGDLAGIWRMVARTADTQLNHSLLALAGAAAGLVATFLLPAAAVLAWPWHGDCTIAALGAAAWLAMAAAFRPTLRLLGVGPAWTLTLPAAALLYLAMTMDSARQHRRGRGGLWKGRVQAG
jgi:hopene-associated glycosyltransferase HpnB